MPLAGDDISLYSAIEDQRGGCQDQPASISANAIALIPAHCRATREQPIGVNLVILRSPAVVFDHERIANADRFDMRWHVADVIEPPVGAKYHARPDIARSVVETAPGDIEGRTFVRHHFIGGKRDRPANRCPFPDTVRGVAEIAADFQEAAGRIPAIAAVTARSSRDVGEVASIDPNFLIVQGARLAIGWTVAQVIGLDAHLDRIRAGIQSHPAHARHVDRRAALGLDAVRGGHRHLSALGQGCRATLEQHVTARYDFHPRLVTAVTQKAEVVELTADLLLS